MGDYDKHFANEIRGVRREQRIAPIVGILVVLASTATIIWGVVTIIRWLVSS